MSRGRLLLLLGAFVLAGCAGPTATIRELGQPAFEPLLGQIRLERVSEPQTGGFDVFDPDTAQKGSDHRIGLRFWPLADSETIAIEIRSRSLGKLRLRDLAAAVYPATRSQCQDYQATGNLPALEPVLYTSDSKDDRGGRILTMTFPRSSLPKGTTNLAVPVLLRFEDGWVRVQYYSTAVPEPLRRETPEAAEARLKKEIADAIAAKRKAEGKSPKDEAPPEEAAPPKAIEGAPAEDPKGSSPGDNE